MMRCGLPSGLMVIWLPSKVWPVTVGTVMPSAGSAAVSEVSAGSAVPCTLTLVLDGLPLGTTVPEEVC